MGQLQYYQIRLTCYCGDADAGCGADVSWTSWGRFETIIMMLDCKAGRGLLAFPTQNVNALS